MLIQKSHRQENSTNSIPRFWYAASGFSVTSFSAYAELPLYILSFEDVVRRGIALLLCDNADDSMFEIEMVKIRFIQT